MRTYHSSTFPANDVFDANDNHLGFRCYVCGAVKDRMWGDVCNECRDKERRHKELVAAIQSSAPVMQKALASIAGGHHADTCSRMLVESHECDCHVAIARAALLAAEGDSNQ